MSYSLTRRQLLTAAALTASFPTLTAVAQVADLNDAINKAGRQRMLSQRMGKAWLALGQQVEVSRAEKVLSDSLAVFDRQLVELKAFAPTADIRSTYSRLDPVWSEFKTVLIGSRPDPSATPKLLALDAQVLTLAHQGTQQLEQHAGKPVSQLINVAGRQRMLSQRIAKFQLAVGYKAPAQEAREQIAQARQEFVAGLDTLANASATTPAIRHQLDLARQQWVFFDAAIARPGEASPRDAAHVFVASENILQVMDQITTQYARLST